ncbi:MAG TPA: ornithine cyclodeaminase family protein [Gemmatimonadales bacterium]|jgi:ornithine cyclodeaminase
MTEILTLSAEDLSAALPMRAAIEAMRTAFAALSAGEVELPHRTRVETGVGAVLLVMPGAAPGPFGLGAKIVSVVEQNPERGLPLVSGAVLLLDRDTGQPAALLNAERLTEIRTGATSGLATDVLARRDARKLGILGAGRQARTQAEAVCAVREIKEVRVWSRTRQRADMFASDLREASWAPPEVSVVDDPSAAVIGFDVVCTATAAKYPVLVGAHGWPGLHVNAVGSFTPRMREIETDLLGAARVVVDYRPAVMEEAGEIIEAIDVGALTPDELIELGDVVRRVARGRTSPDDITVFKSVGIAVQDLVAGSLAVERARAEGLGTTVTL